jgi:inhibitor of cysteine peptidase
MLEKITLKVGDTFAVELNSNPSTGYRWIAEFDSKFLQLDKQDYHSPTNLLGAGGIDRFEFKALFRGVINLRMVYKKPFEDLSIEEKNFQVTIE